MGRPPSNGGPAFRFSATEVKEMEDILKEHNKMPPREILTNLSEMFSNSSERQGKIEIHINQVWNWFQNKRYAIRAKTVKPPAKLNDSTLLSPLSLPHLQPNFHPPLAPHNDFTPQTNATREVSVSAGKFASDSSTIEFEAKSTKDGAWYDVSHFINVKNLDSADPDILVRFSGFGPEDDEWLNVKKLVRQRSLPCESSDCVAVLAGDLILCFQERNEQAIYFDAHVLDAQRRRHDVRGCRCRFLVRYDHDQFEEIVPLRKICRRPETDYRLQVLHTSIESSPQGSLIMAQNLQKTTPENQNAEPATIVPAPTETVQEQSTSVPNYPPRVELSDVAPDSSAPMSDVATGTTTSTFNDNMLEGLAV